MVRIYFPLYLILIQIRIFDLESKTILVKEYVDVSKPGEMKQQQHK